MFLEDLVAYSQDFIERVLDYFDEGHSVRDAGKRFGVSSGSAGRWRWMVNPNLFCGVELV